VRCPARRWRGGGCELARPARAAQSVSCRADDRLAPSRSGVVRLSGVSEVS
jgi:hypothetical protein